MAAPELGQSGGPPAPSRLATQGQGCAAGPAALWEFGREYFIFGLYMPQITGPRTQPHPCPGQRKGSGARGAGAAGLTDTLVAARRPAAGGGASAWAPEGKGGGLQGREAEERPRGGLQGGEGRAGRHVRGERPAAAVSLQAAGQVCGPAAVSPPAASLNGQRLTLWGPLLGPRWEGPPGRAGAVPSLGT